MINQITKLRLDDGREVAFVDWSDKPLYSTCEIQHGSAVQEMDLFQYIVGDPVPAFSPLIVGGQRTATELDTNMASPGSLASTEEMLVYAIRPEVFRLRVTVDEGNTTANFDQPLALNNSGEPNATAIMLAVMHLRLLLTFEVSQKAFAQAGFGYFNFGAGVYASGYEGPLIPMGNHAQKGLPSQEAVRSMSVPYSIGGQEKFRLFLTHMDDGTGNGVELGLNGAEVDDPAQDPDEPNRIARVRIYLDGLYKRPTE